MNYNDVMTVCTNCSNLSSHFKFLNGGWVCSNCGGFEELSGPRVDGTITRNSHRVRTQQEENEGDLIVPHVWDKDLRKEVINPEFVKKYPDKLHYYHKPQDMAKNGLPRLGEAMAKQEESIKKGKIQAEEEYFGEQDKAMEKLMQ